MFLSMSQGVPVPQSDVGDADRRAVYKHESVETTDDTMTTGQQTADSTSRATTDGKNTTAL